MAHQTVVVIPTNGIQPGQGIPGTVIQPPGMVSYVGPQLGDTSNQSQRMSPLDKFVKAETKTLGAIQIMIGLIHIGFGTLVLVLNIHILLGRFIFWTGLFFITSGSISVSAANYRNTSLVRCSVGFNIISALMALISAFLHAVDLSMMRHENIQYWPLGYGLSALFLLFTFLEFCITVSTAHFGCQATCCNMDTSYMTLAIFSGSGEAPTQHNPAPQPYEALDFSPKRETE